MPEEPSIHPYDFTNQTIAVTGGSGVLCAAMARALAGCHANVVILDRDKHLGEQALTTLNGTGGRHAFHRIDVLDREAISSAVDAIVHKYGRIEYRPHPNQ